MILRLRQRHRRVIAVLAVLLPIAFAVGVAARKPLPRVDSLPPEFKATPQPAIGDDWEYTDLFTNVPVRVHQLRNRTEDRRFQIFLSAKNNFIKPDLLVYWLAERPKSVDTFPEEAALLGAFSSPVLVLPGQASKSDGVILLYSFADNEIVDVSQPLSISSEGRVPRGPDQTDNDGDSQRSPVRKE